MYAKILLDGTYTSIFTDQAFTIRNNGKVHWLPKSCVEEISYNYLIIKEFFAKQKGINYEKINLSSLVRKDLKPLQYLVNENIIDYYPKELMEHQKKCFDFAKKLKTVALFLEMGLGKSKLYIDLAEYHYKAGNINNVIFFAPPTTLHNFENELKKWSKTDLQWDVKSIFYLSKSQFNKEIIDFIASINEQTMLIIDESHRIKNVNSNCSKNAQIMGRKASYKIIGTGTSAPNYTMDLIGQFTFLTPSLFPQTKNGLNKLYSINNIGVKTQLKQPIQLLNMLSPYIYSLKKEEALELPELIINKITIHNAELSKFYKEQTKEVVTNFMMSTGSIMGFLQNLRKLSEGRNINNEVVVVNPKINALQELLIDIPNKKKIIIWCNFYREIDDIVAGLGDKYSFLILNGDIATTEKVYVINKFKTDCSIEILIATAQVGGVGLNFTEAEYNIYFSNGFNLIDRLQSMSRSHRIGQQKQVIIYDLEMVHTIDTRILESLDRKEDFMQELNLAMKKDKLEVLTNLGLNNASILH